MLLELLQVVVAVVVAAVSSVGKSSAYGYLMVNYILVISVVANINLNRWKR